MVTRSWCGVLGVLVLLAAGSAAGAVDLTTGLVFHFAYDDPANLYADSSGNGYDGVNKGYALAAEPGVIGGAADFVDEQTTTSYSYFDVAAAVPEAAHPTSAVTVAYWAKVDRFFEPGTEYLTYSSKIERNTIFSTEDYVNGASSSKGTGGICSDVRGVSPTNWAEQAWAASFRTCIRGHDVDGERNLHPIVDYTFGMAADEFISVEQATGKWFHLAVTYDKATASSALYLNGVKVKDLPVIEAVDIEPGWEQAEIGKFTEGGREFRGSMDELYLFSRALSEEEIEVLAMPPGQLDGDLNWDDFVNSGDLDLVRGNWGNGSSTPGWDGDGDANGDGVVNSGDLDIVRANWGSTSSGVVEIADLTPSYRALANPTAVPEPGTFVLLILGIGMVLGRPARSR